MTSLLPPVGRPQPEQSTLLPGYPAEGDDDARPILLTRVLERSDRLFRGVTRSGGVMVLLIMVLVGVFLSVNAVQAISSVGVVEFVTETQWSPETNTFGIAAILTGTVLIAAVALVVALPLALGMSLFLTEVVSGGFQRILRSVIDLMAAVPSVVFGLWGLAFLQVQVVPFARWLSTWFGWIPLFAVDGADPANPLPNDSLYTSSTFIAGLVVALMIVPIMTSMMVESFSRAPIGEREAAFALGATRWGMIRSVVLPFGKGGVIGGTMLGLGRALGETIAIYLIIAPVFQINFHVLQRGANSIAAHIALRYGEASPFAMSALMAAGLALFLLTMLVNFTASTVIARSRSGAESEA
ncbi:MULTISPECIES: phosphate ABC transporter permease subunit PstC [unclassified Rathayibacter]|uniref:phosphate ABC transporter permease subunit PstC n=1 Tax=unclassified Rathayibacter TaxID=2609250 RepID=UPI00188A5D17|nr:MULTISPECIES: phosphate ABC transporter permease subunit PstC [unclassified Rathayibacter]MBF4462740.1 phosphate ABC transporter permease subunit PstC [Rathayibacter sp. VKM Ac-2879]MBF4504154.1 phosphate ABC transporter permease subunit PstC [Rathayibacter sp. VKM Ac-2878]